MNTAANDVRLEGVTHTFGRTSALADVTVTVRGDAITGLIGRNGAGKTTLLRLMAAHLRQRSGRIEMGGRGVWENPDVTSRVYLARHDGALFAESRVGVTEQMHRHLRPRWDGQYFRELLDRFEVPYRRTPRAMSTGQRSALQAAFALASRAEMTLLDEIHLGMDAVSRRTLYDEILADYARHPRGIVISSHLVDEIEPLLEEVVVLDRGRLLAAGECDAVRESHSPHAHLASLTDVLVTLTSGGSR
ncbi:MAG: ATP-binding cassette domain-containing protein [Mobilicoccus sp.]|nr:ATP-binding cassette domain-containing protein [Mobilicoccus sp.]